MRSYNFHIELTNFEILANSQFVSSTLQKGGFQPRKCFLGFFLLQ